ncbi:unnamed protein product [Pleuronectes platessa]|uniref:Uncharacterized protein n=1 Tax=Pleuronectes platessa TaxID=8262 RepID=A0A9N7Y8F4_PLEPL|nr:unnamed protein product [Pleuronectes platessa]
MGDCGAEGDSVKSLRMQTGLSPKHTGLRGSLLDWNNDDQYLSLLSRLAGALPPAPPLPPVHTLCKYTAHCLHKVVWLQVPGTIALGLGERGSGSRETAQRWTSAKWTSGACLESFQSESHFLAGALDLPPSLISAKDQVQGSHPRDTITTPG